MSGQLLSKGSSVSGIIINMEMPARYEIYTYAAFGIGLVIQFCTHYRMHQYICSISVLNDRHYQLKFVWCHLFCTSYTCCPTLSSEGALIPVDISILTQNSFISLTQKGITICDDWPNCYPKYWCQHWH